MSTPYVHSNYERRADDHYPTIDGRCVQALVDSWPVDGIIVDCCAPQDSGIVDWFVERHRRAESWPSVNSYFSATWIVTNPPYDRKVVDGIVSGAVAKVRGGDAAGAAFLMRANWDLAACRWDLFADPLYRGQTRMRFRPWWSSERKANPIHSYAWHVWTAGEGEPVVRYWP